VPEVVQLVHVEPSLPHASFALPAAHDPLCVSQHPPLQAAASIVPHIDVQPPSTQAWPCAHCATEKQKDVPLELPLPPPLDPPLLPPLEDPLAPPELEPELEPELDPEPEAASEIVLSVPASEGPPLSSAGSGPPSPPTEESGASSMSPHPS
jgi:hypothetical protein